MGVKHRVDSILNGKENPIASNQLAIAELAEIEAKHDLENKLAIAELAENLTGGVR